MEKKKKQRTAETAESSKDIITYVSLAISKARKYFISIKLVSNLSC